MLATELSLKKSSSLVKVAGKCILRRYTPRVCFVEASSHKTMDLELLVHKTMKLELHAYKNDRVEASCT